jgi:hypothetical protein
MIRFLCKVLVMQIFVILSVVTVKCPNTTCRYTLCHGAFSVTDSIYFQLVNTMDGDMSNSGCQSHKTFSPPTL